MTAGSGSAPGTNRPDAREISGGFVCFVCGADAKWWRETAGNGGMMVTIGACDLHRGAHPGKPRG